MDPRFFVRFSLQRMGGTLDDDDFNSKDMIKISDEEIEKLTKEFHTKQQEIAQELACKYKEGIKKLEGKKVLFVGDSQTADRMGYRGIVTKAAKLNSVNMSFSGSTSTDMYRFIYEKITVNKPELIFVMIGSNDAFAHSGKEKNRLVSSEEYRRNIFGILKNCVDSGTRTLVSTIPQFDRDSFLKTPDAAFKDNDDEAIAKYNQIVREAAASTGAELIDLEAVLKTMPKTGLYEPDGVHMSINGHKILADLWLDKAISE